MLNSRMLLLIEQCSFHNRAWLFLIFEMTSYRVLEKLLCFSNSLEVREILTLNLKLLSHPNVLFSSNCLSLIYHYKGVPILTNSIPSQSLKLNLT